jgi:hypothetical protein
MHGRDISLFAGIPEAHCRVVYSGRLLLGAIELGLLHRRVVCYFVAVSSEDLSDVIWSDMYTYIHTYIHTYTHAHSETGREIETFAGAGVIRGFPAKV